jgi:hypothetical protein
MAIEKIVSITKREHYYFATSVGGYQSLACFAISSDAEGLLTVTTLIKIPFVFHNIAEPLVFCIS